MTDESNVVDEGRVPDMRRQHTESRILVSGPTGNAADVDQLEGAFEDSVFPAQTLQEVRHSATQNYTLSDFRGASTRQDLPLGDTEGRQLHFSTSQPKQREVSGNVNAAVDRTASPATPESEINVMTTPRRATMTIRYQPPSAINAPLADIQIAKVRNRVGSQAPCAAATPRGSHPSTVSQAVARGIAAGVSQAHAAMERRMASRRQSRQASRMSRRLSPRGSFAGRVSPEAVKQNLLQAGEALRRFEEGVNSERFSAQPYSASTDHAASHRGIRSQSLSEPRVAQVPMGQREQTHVVVAPPAAGGEEGSAGENGEQRELHISPPTSRGARRSSDKPSGSFCEEVVPDEDRREPPAASSRRASQAEKPARLGVLHSDRVQSGIMRLAQLDQQRRASRIASRMASRPISRNPALLGSSVLRNRADVAKAAAEELNRRIAAEKLKAAVTAEATDWSAPGQQDRSPTRRDHQETRSQMNCQLTSSDKKRELVEADTMQMPRGADIESRASFLIREFCSAPIHAHLPLSDRGGNASSLDRPPGLTSSEEKSTPRGRAKSGPSQGESLLGRFFSTLLTFSSSEAASPSVRRRRSFDPIISPSTQSPRQTSLSSSSRDSFRRAEPQATSSPSEDATAGVRGVPRRAHSRRPVRLGKFHEQLPRKALTVTYENCESLLRLWPQSDGASSASSVGTSSSGSHSGRPAGLCTPATCGRGRTWRGSSSRVRRHRADNSVPERFTERHQSHCIASAGERPPGGRREVCVVNASASSSRTPSYYSSSGSLSPRVLPVEKRRLPVSVPVLDFSWLEKIASKRERSGLPPQPRMSRPAVQKKRVPSNETEKLNARLRKQQLSIAREVSLLAARRSVKFVKQMVFRRATIGPVGQREPEKLLSAEEFSSRSPASEKIFTIDRSASTLVAKGAWRTHDSLEGIKGASAGHGRSLSKPSAAALRRPRDNTTSKKRPNSLSMASSFEPEERFTPEVDDNVDASVTPKSPLAWLSHQEHTWNMCRKTDSDRGVYKASTYSEAREALPVSQVPLSQCSISDKPVDQPSISSAQATGFRRNVLQGRASPRLGRAHSVGNSRFTDANASVSLSKFTSTQGKFVYTSPKKGPNRGVVKEGYGGLYIAVEPVLERCRSPDTFQVCHGDNFGTAAEKEDIAQVPADAGDFSAGEGSAHLPLVVRKAQNTVMQSVSSPPSVDEMHTVKRLECEFLGRAHAGVLVRRRTRARSSAAAHRSEVARSCLPALVDSVKRSKSLGSLGRIEFFDSVLPELTTESRVEGEFVLTDRRDNVKMQNLEVSMDGQADVMKEGMIFKWRRSQAIQRVSEPFDGENVPRKPLVQALVQPDLTGSLWGNTLASMERRSSGAADDTPVQRATCNSETMKQGVRHGMVGHEGSDKNIRTNSRENTSKDERTEHSPMDHIPAALQTLQGECTMDVWERPCLRGAGGNVLLLPGCTEGSATLSDLFQRQAGSTRSSPNPCEEAQEYSGIHVDASLNVPVGGAQSQDFNEAEGSNECNLCLHPESTRRVHSSEIKKTDPVSAVVTREMEVFKKSREKGEFTRDIRRRKGVASQDASDISDREANAENGPQRVTSSVVRGNGCEGRTTSGVEAAVAPLFAAEEEPVISFENEVRATQETPPDDEGVRPLQRLADAVDVEGDKQLKTVAHTEGRQTECLPLCRAPPRVENGRGSWKADKMTLASEGEQRAASRPQVGKRSCEGVCPMQKEGESAPQLRAFVKRTRREYVPKGLMQSKPVAAGVCATQSETAEQAKGAKTQQLVNFAEAVTQEVEGDTSFLHLQAGHSARNSPGEHDEVTDKRLPVKEAKKVRDFSGGLSQGQYGTSVGEAARGGNHTRETVRENMSTKGSLPDGEHVTKAATISLGYDSFTRWAVFQEKTAFTWGTDYRGQAGRKAGVLTRSTSLSGIFSAEVPGDGLEEMCKSAVSGTKREVLDDLPRRRDVQGRAQAPEEQTCESPTCTQKDTTSARGKAATTKALLAASAADVELKEGSAKLSRKKVHSELLSVNLGNGMSATEAAGKGVLLEVAEEVQAESVVVQLAQGPTHVINAKQPHVSENMEEPVRKGNEDIHIGRPGVRMGPMMLTPSLSTGESLRDAEMAVGSIALRDNGTAREAYEREDVRCPVEVKVKKRPQQTDDQQGRGELDRPIRRLSRTAESPVPLTKFAAEISTEAMTEHLQGRGSADEPSQERKAQESGREKGVFATRAVEYLSEAPFKRILSEEEDTIQHHKEEDAVAAQGEGPHVFVREQQTTKLPFDGQAKDRGFNEDVSEGIFDRQRVFVCGEPARKSTHEKRLLEGSSKGEAIEAAQGDDGEPSVCKEEAANVEADKQCRAAPLEVEASRVLPEKETVMVWRGRDAHRWPGDEVMTSFSKQDTAEVAHGEKSNFMPEENAAKAAHRRETPKSVVGAGATWATPKGTSVRRLLAKAGVAAAPLQAKPKALLACKASGPPEEGNTTSSWRGKQTSRSLSQEDTAVCTHGGGVMEAGHDEGIREHVFADGESKDTACCFESELLDADVLPHPKEVKPLNRVGYADSVAVERLVVAHEAKVEKNSTDLVPFEGTSRVFPEKKAAPQVSGECGWLSPPEKGAATGVSDQPALTVVREHEICKSLLDKDGSEPVPEEITNSSDEEGSPMSVRGHEAAKRVREKNIAGRCSLQEQPAGSVQRPTAGRKEQRGPLNAKVDRQRWSRGQPSQRQLQVKGKTRAAAALKRADEGRRLSYVSSRTFPVGSTENIPGGSDLKETPCSDARNVPADGLPRARSAAESPGEASEASSAGKVSGDGGRRTTHSAIGCGGEETESDKVVAVPGGNSEWRRQFPRRLQLKKSEFIARWRTTVPVGQREDVGDVKVCGRSVKMEKGRGRKEAATDGDICGPRVGKILSGANTGNRLCSFPGLGKSWNEEVKKSMWTETETKVAAMHCDLRFMGACGDGGSEAFFTAQSEDSLKSTERAREETAASEQLPGRPDASTSLPGQTTQPEKGARIADSNNALSTASLNAGMQDEEASRVSAAEVNAFSRKYSTSSYPTVANDEAPITTAFVQRSVYSDQVEAKVISPALQDPVKQETGSTVQRQRRESASVEPLHTTKPLQKACAVRRSLTTSHSGSSYSSAVAMPSASAASCEATHDRDRSGKIDTKDFLATPGNGGNVAVTCRETIQVGKPGDPTVAKRNEGEQNPRVSGSLAETLPLTTGEQTATLKSARAGRGTLCRAAAVTSDVQVAVQGDLSQRRSDVGDPVSPLAVTDDVPPRTVPLLNVDPREGWATDEAPGEGVSERLENEDITVSAVLVTSLEDKKGALKAHEPNEVETLSVYPQTPESAIETQRKPANDSASQAARGLASARDPHSTNKPQSEPGARDNSIALPLPNRATTATSSKAPVDEGKKDRQGQGIHGIKERPRFRGTDTKNNAAGTAGGTRAGVESFLSPDKLVCQMWRVTGEGRGDADGLFRLSEREESTTACQTTEERGLAENLYYGKKRRATQSSEIFLDSNTLDAVPEVVAEKATRTQPEGVPVVSKLEAALSSVDDLGGVIRDPSQEHPVQFLSHSSSSGRTKSQHTGFTGFRPEKLDIEQNNDLKTVTRQGRTGGAGGTTNASPCTAQAAGVRKSTRRMLLASGVVRTVSSPQVDAAVQREDSGAPRNTPASKCLSDLSFGRGMTVTEWERHTRHEGLSKPRQHSFREDMGDTVEMQSAREGDDKRPAATTKLSVGEKIDEESQAVVDEPADGVQHCIPLQSAHGMTPAPVHRRVSFVSALARKPTTGESAEGEEAVSTDEQRKSKHLGQAGVDGSLSSAVLKKQQSLDEISVLLDVSTCHEVPATCTGLPSDTAVSKGKSAAGRAAARGRCRAEQAAWTTVKEPRRCDNILPLIDASEVSNPSETSTAISASKLPVCMLQGGGDRSTEEKRESVLGKEPQTRAPMSSSASESGAGDISNSCAAAAACVECSRAADASSVAPTDVTALEVPDETTSTSSVPKALQQIVLEKKHIQTSENASAASNSVDVLNSGGTLQAPLGVLEEKTAPHVMSRREVISQDLRAANVKSAPRQAGTGMPARAIPRAALAPSAVEQAESLSSPSQTCARAASAGPLGVPTGFAGSKAVPLSMEAAPPSVAAETRESEFPNATFFEAGEREGDEEAKLACGDLAVENEKRGQSGLSVSETGDELDRWDSTVCPSPPFSPRYVPPVPAPARRPVPPLNFYWLRSGHGRPLQKKRLKDLVKDLHAGLCVVNPPETSAVTLPAGTSLQSDDELDRKKADIVASLFDDAADLDIEGQTHQPRAASSGQTPPCVSTTRNLLVTPARRDPQERLLDLEKSPELKAPRGEHPPIFRGWEAANKLPLMGETAHRCPLTTSDAFVSAQADDEETKPRPPAGSLAKMKGVCAGREIFEAVARTRPRSNVAEPRNLDAKAPNAGDRQLEVVGIGAETHVDDAVVGTSGARSKTVSAARRRYTFGGKAPLYSKLRPQAKRSCHSPTMLPLHVKNGEEVAMVESTTKLSEDSCGSRTREPPVRVPNTATAQGYTRRENSPLEPCPPEEATGHQPCRTNFVVHRVDRRAGGSKEFLPEAKALLATLRSPKQKMPSENRPKEGTEKFSEGGSNRVFTIARESLSAGASGEHISEKFGEEFEVSEAAARPYPRSAAVDTEPTQFALRQRALQVSPQPLKEQMPCPGESSPVYDRIPKEKFAAETEAAGTSASRRRSAEGLPAKARALENVAGEAAKEREVFKEASSLLDMALESSHLSAARKDLQSSRGKPPVRRVKSHASAENISALIKSATMLLRTNQAMGLADTATAPDVGVWRNGRRWEVPVSEAGTSKLDERRPLVRPSPAPALQMLDDKDELEGDKRVGANTRKSGGLWRDGKGRAFTNETVSKRATAPAGLSRSGDAMVPITGQLPRCDTSHFSEKTFQNEGRAGDAAPTLHLPEVILRKDSVVAERIRSFERMAWRRQTARSSRGTSNGTIASNRRKDREARFPPTHKEQATGSPSAVPISERLVHSEGLSLGKVDLREVVWEATTRKPPVIAKGPPEGGVALTSQRSDEAALQEGGRHSSSDFVEGPVSGARQLAARESFAASFAEGEPTVPPWQAKQGDREKADLSFKEDFRRRPQQLKHDTLKRATPPLSRSAESQVGSSAEGDSTAFSRQSVQPHGWTGLTPDEGAATPAKRIEKTPSDNQAVAGAGTVVQSNKQTPRSMVTVARRERQEGTCGTNGITGGDSRKQEKYGELQQDTDAAEPLLRANQGGAATAHLRVGNTADHRLPRRAPLACGSADVSSSSEREESPQRERHEQRSACLAKEQHVDGTATESCTKLSLCSVAHGDFTSLQSSLQRDIRRPVKTPGDAKTRRAEEESKPPQGMRNVIGKRGVACQPALTDISQTSANGNLNDPAFHDKEKKLVCATTACKQDSEAESHKSLFGRAERATVRPAVLTGKKLEVIDLCRPVTAPDVEAAESPFAVTSCPPDRSRLQTPLRAHTETLFANAARLKKTAGLFSLNARAVADLGSASAGETTHVGTFIRDGETNKSFNRDRNGNVSATAGAAETPCASHKDDLQAARCSRGSAIAHPPSEKDTWTSVEVSGSSAKASAAGTAEGQSSARLSVTWKPTRLRKAAAGAAFSSTTGRKRRASHQVELPELRTAESPVAVASTTGRRKAWKCLSDSTALVEPSHELAAHSLEEAKAVFLQSWWKAVTVRKWVNAAKCVRDFESSASSMSSPGRLHAPECGPPLQDGSSPHMTNPEDVVLASATPDADLTAARAASGEYAVPSSRRKSVADLLFEVLATEFHEKQTRSSSSACWTLPQLPHSVFGGRVESEPGCGSNAQRHLYSSTGITKTTSECEAEPSYRRDSCRYNITSHPEPLRGKRKGSSRKGLALTSACGVLARDGQMKHYPRHTFLPHAEAEDVEAEQSCRFNGVRIGSSEQHADGTFTGRSSVAHPQRVRGNTFGKDAFEGCRREGGNQQYKDRLECVDPHGGQVEARAAEGPEANGINRQEASANGRQTEVHGGNTGAAEDQDFNTSYVMAVVPAEEGLHGERRSPGEVGIRSKPNQQETLGGDVKIFPRREAETGDSGGPGECRQLTERRSACEQIRQLKEVRNGLPIRIMMDLRGEGRKQAVRSGEETGESLDGKGLTGEKHEQGCKRGLEKSVQVENKKCELQNAETKKSQLRDCNQATMPFVTGEAEILERGTGEVYCRTEESCEDVERGNSRAEKLVTVGKQNDWEVKRHGRELPHGKEVFQYDGVSLSSGIHHDGFYSDKDAELVQVSYSAKGSGTGGSHLLPTAQVKLGSCISSSDCTMHGGRATSPYGCKDAREEEHILAGQNEQEDMCRSPQRARSGLPILSTNDKGQQSVSGCTREARHLVENQESFPTHASGEALTALQDEARICATREIKAHLKGDPMLTHDRVGKQKGTVTCAEGQVKIGRQRQNQKEEARGELDYVRSERDFQAPSSVSASVAEREKVFRSRDELENAAEVEEEMLVSWRAVDKEAPSEAQTDQANGTAEAREECRGEALFRSSEEKTATEKHVNTRCSNSEGNVPGSDDEPFLSAFEADDEEDTFAQLVGAKKASLL